MYLVRRPLAVVTEAFTRKGLELVFSVLNALTICRAIRSTADFAGGSRTYRSREFFSRTFHGNPDSRC
jgi:hypothetical protein